MTKAKFGYDGSETPWRLRYRTLQELLPECTPENLPLAGETVRFEIDGIDPSEMFLSVTVRQRHPSKASNLYFPLDRLQLEGPHAMKIGMEWVLYQLRLVEAGEVPPSLMFGKGAFRSLIQYLERELPSRGFEGILLERVGNEKLRSAAERYGFVPTGLPVNLDFVKHLNA